MNSIVKGKRIFVSAIFLSLLGGLLNSCKKEDSDIGLGLQPEEDLLNATLVDTFTLKTYSQIGDSLSTDERTSSLLGSYVDPVFGKSTASIYTQFGISVPNTTVDMGITTVDSVHIHLRYAGYYGKLDPQTFTVQQVTQRFFKDSVYYANSQRTTTGVELMLPGAETVTPNTTDSVTLGSQTVLPMLVLKLNPTFGTDLLNAVSAGHLANETAFGNYFYGLKIGVNNPGQPVNSGAILYFTMADAQTRMVIYYTEGTTKKEMSFPVGANQARFSQFEHDYTGTPVEAQLSNPALGQKFFYTQSMSGVNGIIEIPGISRLREMGNIIINKAELYFPVEHFITSPYVPAGSNILVYKKEDGTYGGLYDQAASPATYDGLYIDSRKAVVFNIGRHIQRVVKGELPNLGFMLVNGSNSVQATRNIYNGQQSPNREKPYLKVYYTKY